MPSAHVKNLVYLAMVQRMTSGSYTASGPRSRLLLTQAHPASPTLSGKSRHTV